MQNSNHLDIDLSRTPNEFITKKIQLSGLQSMDVLTQLSKNINAANDITGIKRNLSNLIKRKKDGKRRRSFWTHQEDQILTNWVKREGPVKW